jgi:hypothetical protein
MSAPYKVVLWGPGQVGKEALQTIIEHPDLELVGVRVYSESKEGMDAGEIYGSEPVGVKATRDVDALLGLAPDCVCYAASDHFGMDVVIGDICRILSKGINVSDATGTHFAYPPLIPEGAKQIEDAAKTGGATFYFCGVNPGLFTDVMPALLSTAVRRIDSVEIHEHFDISTYKDAMLLARFGFGKSPDDWTAEQGEEIARYLWTPSAHLVARSLGAEDYDIRITYDITLAEESFEVKGDQSSATYRGLPVNKGTINGAHCTIEFVVDGTPRVVWHEYIRVTADPVNDPWPADWPVVPGGPGTSAPGGYRAKIHGQPSVHADFWFDSGDNPHWAHGSSLGGGMMSTGVRIAKAIPLVCQAAPGYYTPMDLNPPELNLGTIGKVHWARATSGAA